MSAPILTRDRSIGADADDVRAAVGRARARRAGSRGQCARGERGISPLAAAGAAAELQRRRRDRPFEGDLAAVRLRERPSLEPGGDAAAAGTHGSSVGVLARVIGAIGLAALAAVFMVGTVPLKGAVKAEAETALPRGGRALRDRRERASARQPRRGAGAVALADRFAAAPNRCRCAQCRSRRCRSPP